MGLIIDSTIPMKAERGGLNARQAIMNLRQEVDDQAIAISVISLVEFAHGIERANTELRLLARRQFLQDIKSILPVYPVTKGIAIRAGLLDGAMSAKGLHVALGDMLIAATALELGFKVATHNVKHFRLIPGIEIIPF